MLLKNLKLCLLNYFYKFNLCLNNIDRSFFSIYNLVFFIIGIGFSKLIFSSITPDTTSLNLPLNSIILTVSSSNFSQVPKIAVRLGDDIYLVRKKFNANNLFCRLHKNTFKIISINERLSLKIPASEINNVLLILKKQKQRQIPQIFIIQSIYAKKLPLCSKNPRVAYEF